MTARVRRTQGERSEQTRRQLVNAAIAIVLEEGLANATVVEICRRAEVTTGALQHHFRSKSELLASVVTELFVPFTREIEPLTRPETIPLDQRVRRLVDRYWKIYGDPRYFAVLEVLNAIRYEGEMGAIVKRFRSEQGTVLEDFLPREFPDVDMTPMQMRLAVHWVLGRPGVFLNTVGDIHILPLVLDAAERFQERPSEAAMAAMAEAHALEPLFV